MKWAVVILIFLGIVAAVCASIMVTILRAESKPEASLVEVVVAKQTIPAMTVLEGANLSLQEVDPKELPAGFLTSTTQAAGKVLAVSVVEGQVLTSQSFVTDGSGAQLAAALSPGMRAVSLPVSSYSITGGFLYPGCVVDVLASFHLKFNSGVEGEAISTTLLHAVQVLAVEDVSIVSKPEAEGESTRQSARNRQLSVTLMVDNKQAEALQLAMENGKISLALRNPLDKKQVETDATILNQGQLARLGSVLPSAVMAELNKETGSADFADRAEVPDRFRTETDGWLDLGEPEKRKPANWRVTVIRGNNVEEKVLEIEEEM